MRGRSERCDRLPHHLRTAARRRTQACLARVTLSHFQKAGAKTAPRRRIVRALTQGTPEQIGSGVIFAILRQHSRQRRQNIVPLRGYGDGLQQHGAGLGAIIALDMRERQRHTQINRSRREGKSAFEYRDRLVATSAVRELTAVFQKCRQEWGPPRRGSLQLTERRIRLPRGAQGAGEFDFDRRIIAATCRPLQRDNRFDRAVLHQQRASENLRRKGIATIRLQYAGGDALRFIGTLHTQRQNRAVERVLAGARPIEGSRT